MALDVLDSLLTFLEANLPPSVYSVVISFLSHVIALCTVVLNLLSNLLSTNPFQWEAQTVIPPIIAILSIYLALSALYRSAVWFIRTGIWFIKWGGVIAVVVACAGVVYRAANTSGDSVSSRMLSQFANTITGLLYRQSNQKAASMGSMKYDSHERGRRPQAWDSFAVHEQWQYEERSRRETTSNILNEIISTAGGLLTGSWWEAPPDPRQEQKQAKVKGSRSR